MVSVPHHCTDIHYNLLEMQINIKEILCCEKLVFCAWNGCVSVNKYSG
jgi:hypothetical protein